MRKIVTILMVLALVVVSTSCSKEKDGDTPAPPPDVTDVTKGVTQPDADDTPEVPKVDVTEKMVMASCAECHGIEKVTGTAKNREDWVAQIEMCMDGKDLAEADTGKMADWLAKHHGAE